MKKIKCNFCGSHNLKEMHYWYHERGTYSKPDRIYSCCNHGEDICHQIGMDRQIKMSHPHLIDYPGWCPLESGTLIGHTRELRNEIQ